MLSTKQASAPVLGEHVIFGMGDIVDTEDAKRVCALEVLGATFNFTVYQKIFSIARGGRCIS